MPGRRSHSEQDRAEARRRARLAAQGKDVPPEDAAPESTTPSPQSRPPNLFARLFPPAPPLPGKGDPLAGFTHRGRFAGIVAGGWLLAHHPLTWGVAAAGWALLQFTLVRAGGQNMIAFAITLGQYTLLIGAGWIGWWRPWLFGAAAGVFGVIVYGLIEGIGEFQKGGDLGPALAVFGGLSTLVSLYGLVGAFAGFYGGYLRRRMARPAPANKKRR
jgi:hypothetical protein